MTAHAIAFGNRVDAVEHETDEPVALAFHARHHRGAVDPHRALQAQAERVPARSSVRSFGGGDQELARHASHPSARGAVRAAFDEHGALATGDRGAVGGESGGAGADHGNVDDEIRMCGSGHGIWSLEDEFAYEHRRTYRAGASQVPAPGAA